jgi:hypothetical protein
MSEQLSKRLFSHSPETGPSFKDSSYVYMSTPGNNRDSASHASSDGDGASKDHGYSAATIRRPPGISVWLHKVGEVIGEEVPATTGRVLRSLVSEELLPLHTLQGKDFLERFFEIITCVYPSTVHSLLLAILLCCLKATNKHGSTVFTIRI